MFHDTPFSSRLEINKKRIKLSPTPNRHNRHMNTILFKHWSLLILLNGTWDICRTNYIVSQKLSLKNFKEIEIIQIDDRQIDMQTYTPNIFTPIS
jgi:hypothetical protein